MKSATRTSMHPILFEIAGYPVAAYGMALLLAFVVGISVAVWRARTQGLDGNRVLDEDVLVPVYVYYAADRQQALRLAMTDNSFRRDFDDVEKLRAIQEMDRVGVQLDEIASSIGTSTFVTMSPRPCCSEASNSIFCTFPSWPEWACRCSSSRRSPSDACDEGSSRAQCCCSRGPR